MSKRTESATHGTVLAHVEAQVTGGICQIMLPHGHGPVLEGSHIRPVVVGVSYQHLLERQHI